MSAELRAAFKSLCLRVKIHYQTPMWVTGDSRFRLKCDFGLKCSAKKGGGGVRHWCLKEVVSSVGVCRRWCQALVSEGGGVKHWCLMMSQWLLREL